MNKLAPMTAAILLVINSSLFAATTIPVTQSIRDATWQSQNSSDSLEFVPQGVHDMSVIISLDAQCGKSIKCNGFYITCNGTKAHIRVNSYPYTNTGAYYCRTSRAFTVVNDGASAGTATGIINIDVLN